MLPVAGIKTLSDEQAAKRGPEHLSDKLRQRLSKESVAFKLMLQIADPGDKLDDPSITWPETRRTVELGTLTLTKVIDDSLRAEGKLLFLPNALPEGIAAEDPMINARSDAYPVSYARRHR